MAGGIDPRVDAIPVAPAAHYRMGGITADAEGDRTSLPRLFAVGECASIGVHRRQPPRLQLPARSRRVRAPRRGRRPRRRRAGDRALAIRAFPDLPDAALQQLRGAMARDAGVVRDAAGLTRLIAEIDTLQDQHGRGPVLAAARRWRRARSAAARAAGPTTGWTIRTRPNPADPHLHHPVPGGRPQRRRGAIA